MRVRLRWVDKKCRNFGFDIVGDGSRDILFPTFIDSYHLRFKTGGGYIVEVDMRETIDLQITYFDE